MTMDVTSYLCSNLRQGLRKLTALHYKSFFPPRSLSLAVLSLHSFSTGMPCCPTTWLMNPCHLYKQQSRWDAWTDCFLCLGLRQKHCQPQGYIVILAYVELCNQKTPKIYLLFCLHSHTLWSIVRNFIMFYIPYIEVTEWLILL